MYHYMVTFQPKYLEIRVEVFYQVLTKYFRYSQEGAAYDSEEKAGGKSHRTGQVGRDPSRYCGPTPARVRLS